VVTVKVKVRRLGEGPVALPVYQSPGAAGVDLAAHLSQPQTLAPGARAAIPTGIAVEIPLGYEGQVRPRSGRALCEGLTLINSPGTIDADYRGEVKVLLVNLGDQPVTIQPGERIAQMVIAPVARIELVPADALSDSGRGPGGFGHTGR